MTRTEQRECVFKLLFRVEFNEPDEMAQQKVLFFADDETSYSEKDQAYIADKFELTLPDEYFRRVGQSMAVASLPEL